MGTSTCRSRFRCLLLTSLRSCGSANVAAAAPGLFTPTVAELFCEIRKQGHATAVAAEEPMIVGQGSGLSGETRDAQAYSRTFSITSLYTRYSGVDESQSSPTDQHTQLGSLHYFVLRSTIIVIAYEYEYCCTR